MKEMCIIASLYWPRKMKNMSLKTTEQINLFDKTCDSSLDLLTTLHNYNSSSTMSFPIDHFSHFPKAH